MVSCRFFNFNMWLTLCASSTASLLVCSTVSFAEIHLLIDVNHCFLCHQPCASIFQVDVRDGRPPVIKKYLFPLFSPKNSIKHSASVRVLPVVSSPMVHVVLQYPQCLLSHIACIYICQRCFVDSFQGCFSQTFTQKEWSLFDNNKVLLRFLNRGTHKYIDIFARGVILGLPLVGLYSGFPCRSFHFHQQLCINVHI